MAFQKNSGEISLLLFPKKIQAIQKFEGAGLGLSLVKQYVNLNNITIKLDSEKGKGSTATVIFNN